MPESESIAAPLTCRELVELVTDYFENALLPGQRTRLKAHLAECDGCTTYIEQMRQTMQALGRLDEHEISPVAQGTLSAVFQEWRKQRDT